MPKGKFKETGSSAMPKRSKKREEMSRPTMKRADGTFKIKRKSGLGNGPKDY